MSIKRISSEDSQKELVEIVNVEMKRNHDTDNDAVIYPPVLPVVCLVRQLFKLARSSLLGFISTTSSVN